MINNRQGPYPAVSYYRSGAPPGCDFACIDNRLYEVEWERCARAAPVTPKIRDALAVLGDCFAENPFKRRRRKGYAEDAERNLCFEGFEALCGFIVAFVVNQFKHRVPIAIGSNEDTEDTEMNMSYGSMMT